MMASELIKKLQHVIDIFGKDPHVVIQITDDGSWNERDVYDNGRRGLMYGYIGDEPAIVLEYTDTLLGIEVEG